MQNRKLQLTLKVIEKKQAQGCTCLALLEFVNRIMKKNPVLRKFEWHLMSAIFN